ncbi:MAG: peroxin [Geoglossum umbratile]|nr:MAG: peroxin [Geoglossum umbratile]
MIRATRNWFRRNRTNFALGFGVLGVGYVASQYVLSKLAEARERMSSDRIAKENLRRRFEQNQEDCTFTVLALLPTATENILEALRVESITHELQQKRAEHLLQSAGAADVASSELSSGPPSVADDDGRSLQSFQSESYVHASQNLAEPLAGGDAGQSVLQQRTQKSKVKLWNELKISSVTRAFTLIYTLSLLTLLTRIQLNLLGRRNYLSSVVSLASHPPNESTINLENRDDDNLGHAYGNDFETNRRYLTFSWWLLHRGWKDIMTKVEVAVREVFGPLSPREDITLEKLSELVIQVRKKVEGSTETERRNSKWLAYLLPPREQEDYVLRESGMSGSATLPTTTDPPHMPLRRLLDETSDLIDSPPFTHVQTKLLDAGFSVLVNEKLRLQAFKLAPESSLRESRVQEVSGDQTETETEAKTRVANVLAVLTRQAHSIGLGANADEKVNEYLRAMEQERDLEGFAAIVYSSNFEFEAPTTGGAEDDDKEGTRPKPEVLTTSRTMECGESFADMSLVEAELENAWGKATEHSG